MLDATGCDIGVYRHGQVMTRFTHACERGMFFRAELAAREMPRMSFAERPPSRLRLRGGGLGEV